MSGFSPNKKNWECEHASGFLGVFLLHKCIFSLHVKCTGYCMWENEKTAILIGFQTIFFPENLRGLVSSRQKQQVRNERCSLIIQGFIQ